MDAGSCRSLLPGAANDEERVVDSHRQADEQDEVLGVLVDRDDVLGHDSREAEGDDDTAETEEHRDRGRDDRAEREEQDDEGDREAEDLGPLEVLAHGGVDLPPDRAGADLPDDVARMGGSEPCGLRDHRADDVLGRRQRGRFGARSLIRPSTQRDLQDDAASVRAGQCRADRGNPLDLRVCRAQVTPQRGENRWIGARERRRHDALGGQATEVGRRDDGFCARGVPDELIRVGNGDDPRADQGNRRGERDECGGDDPPAAAHTPRGEARVRHTLTLLAFPGSLGVDRDFRGVALGHNEFGDL